MIVRAFYDLADQLVAAERGSVEAQRLSADLAALIASVNAGGDFADALARAESYLMAAVDSQDDDA